MACSRAQPASKRWAIVTQPSRMWPQFTECCSNPLLQRKSGRNSCECCQSLPLRRGPKQDGVSLLRLLLGGVRDKWFGICGLIACIIYPAGTQHDNRILFTESL